MKRFFIILLLMLLSCSPKTSNVLHKTTSFQKHNKTVRYFPYHKPLHKFHPKMASMPCPAIGR